MIKLAKRTTQTLIALHGWGAILLGFLLFAVVATGTVAVLADEIMHWSIGDVQTDNVFRDDTHAIVAELAKRVDERFLEEVGLGTSPAGQLLAFFHTHRTNAAGAIEDYGVQFEVNPVSRAVLSEQHGTGAELFRNGEAGALSRFLVDVHTELHLPRPWGLLLTGILGLMMMSAAVSGFLMHRHLLADMFLNRPRRSELTVRKDAHAVAGTWGLPFAFLLAFTGCFFSFAGSFGLPAMAMVAFGGDQEAMMRTLLGAPAATTDESRTGANLNLIVEDVRQRSGELPRNLLISHYGKADASVLVTAEPRKTQVQALQFEYDGVTGEFRRERPVVGQHPSLGASLFSLIQPLHFGHFAGLFSKFIWVALGFATCYLITSGFSLWLARRREEPKWRLFARCTYVFSSGLPIAMLAAAAAYFVSGVIGLNPVEVLPPVFIGVATLIIALGVLMKDARQLKGLLVTAAALLCLALPPVRLLTGGPSWSMALSGHNIAVPMIDLLLVLAGTFCIVSLLRDARVRNKTIRLRGELNAAG